MRINADAKTATRRRILDTARSLFAQQGFAATTTRDIASAAGIAAGTLFNYFPTKESIVEEFLREACDKAAAEFPGVAAGLPHSDQPDDSPQSLEEALFAHLAGLLRKLKPHRKYLSALLETTLSPLADRRNPQDGTSIRSSHLEVVGQIIAGHGYGDALSALALQMYWTLVTGALAFWSQDSSPRQEDTLALLDQSLAMFTAWLAGQSDRDPHSPPNRKG